jgi:16S rRNA (guanine527-N7)-methyltransferase
LPIDVDQRLTDGLAQLGVRADAALTGAMLRYLALLQQWNRAYNLTSVTELEEMAVRHILDSASARPYLAGAAILDAGTGAGLPGIPLALLEPARQFTLLDSVGKKVRFLRQVVMELKLANVTPVQARLESWPGTGPFDTAICRALGSLGEFAALCGRLVAPAGRLVAMKGRLPAEEIADLPAPWRVAETQRVTVPGLEAERHIVVLERRAHG